MAHQSAKNIAESGVARREAELVERQKWGYCLAEERCGVTLGLGPAGIDAHRKPFQPT